MSNAPSLIDIIRANAAWVAASGYEVECFPYSAVSIRPIDDMEKDEQNSIFMQGEEGENFMNEAERLWNETLETTIDECRAHLARQYIESLI